MTSSVRQTNEQRVDNEVSYTDTLALSIWLWCKMRVARGSINEVIGYPRLSSTFRGTLCELIQVFLSFLKITFSVDIYN